MFDGISGYQFGIRSNNFSFFFGVKILHGQKKQLFVSFFIHVMDKFYSKNEVIL